MNHPLELDTKNLLLKQITPSDWALFHHLETDKSVQQYVADIRCETEIQQRFNERLPQWHKENNQWLCLVIHSKNTGEKVGITGFHPDWQISQEAEVGFMVMPEFQGQGIGKESLMAVLEFAFDECRFSKVNATVTKGNDASCQLLEKVGFQLEKVIPENYQINGNMYDDIIYGLERCSFITV